MSISGERGFFNREQLPGENRPKEIITPETLWVDNHSSEANRRRSVWELMRSQGRLTVFKACSDARLFLPYEDSISIRSIATAGSEVPYHKLVESPGVRRVVVIAHHDGDTVQKGKRPEGCGGLGAKASVDTNGSEKGISRFIRENVRHPDVILQAWISAENIAAKTGKPVLAATQDHLDGTIYPIASFENGTQNIHTGVRLKYMLQDQYDPTTIYENGIPTMDQDMIPDEFKDIIAQNRQEVVDRYIKYPNIRRLQKVQNPRMVVFSTDIRSTRIRYPSTADFPGSLFKLHVPREKVKSTIRIDHKSLIEGLDQAQYPFQHAVENYGKTGSPFSSTDRFLIETGDIDVSKELAENALKEEWMQKWIGLRDHHIFVAQTKRGILSYIEQYT